MLSRVPLRRSLVIEALARGRFRARPDAADVKSILCSDPQPNQSQIGASISSIMSQSLISNRPTRASAGRPRRRGPASRKVLPNVNLDV
jgi:hypothetical protein